MVKWYINRLRTMSPSEILYRGKQYAQKGKEKRNKKLFHQQQDFDKVYTEAIKNLDNVLPLPIDLISQFQKYKNFEFFGLTIDLENKINWHLDIQSGKTFPLKFSKDIDIRSGEYGNAKIVWEINRLQFLLPLAVKYRLTNDEVDLQSWISLVKSWVRENPYLKGINWYSNIEINIRLIVWYFCWQILFGDDRLKKNDEFIRFTKEVWLPIIYDHCVYSNNNPSKYSSANNHLIAEYSGLFIASVCWPFKEADKWNVYAQNGLEKEIIKQHSENGINKEEASEYIQFITDFFLIPFAIAEKRAIQFSETYKKSLYKICEYVQNLLDIKGGFVKYGDEDDGKVLIASADPHFNNFLSILISGAILFKEKQFKKNYNKFDFKNWLIMGEQGRSIYDTLGNNNNELKSAFYNDDGHFIFRKTYKENPDKEIYLHLDAAPLGFLSIAAHGHADALSIILTLDGNPILVDAGTYTYHTEKEWRKYFVSTVAHNTICIDNINQAEYIGPTMWLQHYEVDVLNITQQENIETVSAKHNGYSKIDCYHERTIEFNREKEFFVITDDVSVNDEPHIIFQPWHLHPEVSVEKIDKHTFILRNDKINRKVKIEFSPLLNIEIINGQTEPIMGWYSPSFLKKVPTRVFHGSMETNGSKKIILTTILQII